MAEVEIDVVSLAPSVGHPSSTKAQIDPLLTVREGSALLGTSVPTFWRWVANGILPRPVKLGGMSRWPQSELLAFIEAAKAQRNKS